VLAVSLLGRGGIVPGKKRGHSAQLCPTVVAFFIVSCISFSETGVPKWRPGWVEFSSRPACLYILNGSTIATGNSSK
jgi:hypothetical protein